MILLSPTENNLRRAHLIGCKRAAGVALDLLLKNIWQLAFPSSISTTIARERMKQKGSWQMQAMSRAGPGLSSANRNKCVSFGRQCARGWRAAGRPVKTFQHMHKLMLGWVGVDNPERWLSGMYARTQCRAMGMVGMGSELQSTGSPCPHTASLALSQQGLRGGGP